MKLALLFSFVISSVVASAQSDLRVDEIEAGRNSKLEKLTPEDLTRLERRITWWERSTWVKALGGGDGLHLRLGGLAQAQGFALGPSYTRTDLWEGRFAFSTSFRGSTHEAYLADLAATLTPTPNGKTLFATFGSALRLPEHAILWRRSTVVQEWPERLPSGKHFG